MYTTKLAELKASWKQVRGDLASRGLLSDPSRPETAMAKIIDGLVFIAEGQFNEIAKLKKDVHEIEKQQRAQAQQAKAGKS
jgi:hypothetical protein